MAWQGLALAQAQATVAGPLDTRTAALAAARLRIAAANHLDTEAIEPLLAYYASHELAGVPVPVTAIDGLQKAMEAVPVASATRIQLGSALLALGRLDAARSPPRPRAKAVLD